jgi:hypothetical protein
MVELGGHLATNAGVAISGAAVAVFATSVNATQATSTDCAVTCGTTVTSSGGDWSFSGLAANTYDVRITCGSSVRWRRYIEEVQITTGTLANLDVDGTVDADVTDFDVLSSGDIDLVSSANAAAAIYIAQSTGTSATIKIHADTGTSVTEGAESINILSDVGGVGIRSTANLAKAVNITSDGGTTGSISIFNDQGSSVTEGAESISLLSDAGGIGIRSTANLANAVNITADGGSTSTIQIYNDQGTSVTEGAASIALVSDAGGVELRSTANLANSINITSDGGTTGTISIFNDLGSSVTEGAESISLLSDAGGVGIRSTANLANAVNITADGGTTSTIQIFNDQGTTATEGAASIQLLSDVGGIGVKSGLNAAGAIRLTADAGTSETIILHADQGNGVGSICLTSDVGGITLNPATFVTIGGNTTNAGEIRIMEDGCAGTNYVAIKAQNMGASYTLTLPDDDGCCGEALTTNGSGLLTWAAAAGGRSVAGDTDNGIITWVTSDNTFAAEASLTYDGTTLTIPGQIAFPGTQSASAGANTLDDYEEGTFTPLLQDDSRSAGTESYHSQVGSYTKQGDRVHIQIFIHINSVGNLGASEQAMLGGIPIPSNSTTGRIHGITVGHAGSFSITINTTVAARIDENKDYMHLTLWDQTTGPSFLLISEFTDDGSIYVTGVYQA